MAKIITAAEAADLIRDGMTLGVSGFGAFASPDCVMEAMSRKFKEQNTPRDLTIVSGVAPGDFVEDGCGLSKIRDEGIIMEQGTPAEVFGNPQNPRTQDFLKKVL